MIDASVGCTSDAHRWALYEFASTNGNAAALCVLLYVDAGSTPELVSFGAHAKASAAAVSLSATARPLTTARSQRRIDDTINAASSVLATRRRA